MWSEVVTPEVGARSRLGQETTSTFSHFVPAIPIFFPSRLFPPFSSQWQQTKKSAPLQLSTQEKARRGKGGRQFWPGRAEQGREVEEAEAERRQKSDKGREGKVEHRFDFWTRNIV